jgi:predicted metalloprotease with PDZ domain
MRDVYSETQAAHRGFTGDDWWSAVRGAAGGRSFEEFYERFIDGREPYPWATLLPLAGMKLVEERYREPRIGIQLSDEPDGVVVQNVVPGSMAAQAGMHPGDRLVRIGGIEVNDLMFGEAYRSRYSAEPEGTSVAITVERDGRTVELEGRLRFDEQWSGRIEPDPAAEGKALRIREGILRGPAR